MRCGYNQSELLAREVSALSAVPYDGTLVRCRATRPPANLTLLERQKNLKNAFAPRNNFQYRNQSVLLFDDVLTTGSTLDACATCLENSGAATVTVITIARG